MAEIDIFGLSISISSLQVQNPSNDQEWFDLKSDDVEAIEYSAKHHKQIATLRKRKLDTDLPFLKYSSSDDENNSNNNNIASSLIFSFDLETGIAIFVTTPSDPVIVTAFRYKGTNPSSGDGSSMWLPSTVRRKQGYALVERIIGLSKIYDKDERKSCRPCYDSDHATFSHCHNCAQKFGFFRWRHACTGCLYQFCSSCAAEGEGIKGGLLCQNCKLFLDYTTNPLVVEGNRLALEVFSLKFSVFNSLRFSDELRGQFSYDDRDEREREEKRTAYFAERTYGELEVGYLLDVLINIARLETSEQNAQQAANDFVELIKSTGNEVWIKDAEEVIRQNSSSAVDQSLEMKKLILACAHEAGVLLGNGEMVSSDIPSSSASMFLISQKENLNNAKHMFSFLNTRMSQAFRGAAKIISSTTDFSSATSAQKQAGLGDLVGLLNHLKKDYFDEQQQQSSKKTSFEDVIAKLCQKLDDIGTSFEQESENYAKLPVDHWQRELARSFKNVSQAIDCVSSIFLYTLEELPLYRLLNEAVRSQMSSDDGSSYSSSTASNDTKSAFMTLPQYKNSSFALCVLNPLRRNILCFLDQMPGHPRVVYRGQSYRVAEQLDDDLDGFIASTLSKTSSSSPSSSTTSKVSARTGVLDLPQFTSTTTLFNVAHDIFLNGNRAGSFLIYIAYQSVAIGRFSAFEAESEVLLPVAEEFEVVHRVPPAHLAVMDQRFDVACLQQTCSNRSNLITPSKRLQLSLEAQRAISNAYKEIQRFFIAPHLKEILERPMRGQQPQQHVQLLDAVNKLLSNPSFYRDNNNNNNNNNATPSDFNWLCCSAIAGMGKSSLSIFLQSYVNENQLHGYHAVLLSLPSLPVPHKTLFSEENANIIEQYLLHRFKLPSTTNQFLDLLREEKILLILDSLDEVPLSAWPQDKPLFPSLHVPGRWKNLKVILTCRGEHLRQHKLMMDTLSARRGKTFTIEPFANTEVEQLTNIWIPGAGETGAKVRQMVKQAYETTTRDEMKTPFNLYLLMKAFGAQLMLRRGHPFPATAQELLLANEMQQRRDEQQQQRTGSPSSSTTATSMRNEEFISNNVLTQRWENDRLSSTTATTNAAGGDIFANLTSRAAASSSLLPPATLRDEQQQQQREVLEENNSSNLPWREQQEESSVVIEDICDIYEQGIKGLIAQNAEHLYRDVSDADMKRIVNDVFEWSQFVAVLMLTDTNMSAGSKTQNSFTSSAMNASTIDAVWRSSLGEEALSSILFGDQSQRWFFDDPTVMLQLAPLRLSGCSSVSPFEFRHKSIHEFLAAFAVVKSTNTRIIQIAREIEITQYPNTSMFYGALKANPNNNKSVPLLPSLLDQVTDRKLNISDLTKYICQSSSSSNSSSSSRLCLHEIYLVQDGRGDVNSISAGIVELLSSNQKALKFLSNLTHLEITCGKMIQNQNTLQVIKALLHLLITVSASCKLETIVFDHPDLDDEILTPFFSSPAASNLRQIAIINSTKISSAPFKQLRKAHSETLNLYSLDLSGCSNPELSSTFLQLCHEDLVGQGKNHVKNPRFFNISNTKEIFSDSDIDYILEGSVQNLRAINLKNSSAPKNSNSKKSSSSKFSWSSDLRSVDISGCEDRAFSSDAKVTTYCSGLVRFLCANNRNGVRALTSISYSSFKSSQLAIVDLDGRDNSIDDSEVGKIANLCPRLMHLSISGSRVRDRGIFALASKLLPGRLRYLNIDRPDYEDKRSDKSIIALIQNQPNLRSLNIAFNNKFTNDVMWALEKNTENTGSLRSLDISFIHGGITDRALRAVIKANPNLRYLCFCEAAHQISDSSCVDASNNCLDLRSIDLTGMQRQVSDTGLVAIATKCKNLRRLILDDGYAEYSPDSIAAVAKNLKKLEVIHFDCDELSGEQLKNLARGCPCLRELKLCGRYEKIGPKDQQAVQDVLVLLESKV